MYKNICILFFFLCSSAFSQEVPKKQAAIKYYGRESFLIEGTSISETEKESPYDRLPASYKEKVREPLWKLSKNSAGISLRFLSNSSTVKVKWELMNDTKMNHMAETGIKGVDLYCKVNGSWQYVNTGRPAGVKNDFLLVGGMTPVMREYKLYLPLYDGVNLVEIGIDSLSTIEKPAAEKKLPIVFYGTSITQGGCASRPGMVYTSIISRKLGVDCINLGFSGNGKMEAPISELMAGTKASFYVIDCLPNMTLTEVQNGVIPLAEAIRARQAKTPIVFLENSMYSRSYFVNSLKDDLNAKNQALRTEFEKLVKKGMKNIYYINNKGDLGDDGEGAVDGTHLTDLGFLRFADHLIKNFKKNDLKIVE